MNKILFSTLLLVCSNIAIAQDSFSTLEEQMTGKEFTSAGLTKLSPDELAALNAWLRAHSVGTVATVQQTFDDTRGYEAETAATFDDADVMSFIDGTFSGWDGSTVFKLKNGMIWKQAEAQTWYTQDMDSPEVKIERGVFNSWRLSVVGYGKRVRVERIQ